MPWVWVLAVNFLTSIESNFDLRPTKGFEKYLKRGRPPIAHIVLARNIFLDFKCLLLAFNMALDSALRLTRLWKSSLQAVRPGVFAFSNLKS